MPLATIVCRLVPVPDPVPEYNVGTLYPYYGALCPYFGTGTKVVFTLVPTRHGAQAPRVNTAKEYNVFVSSGNYHFAIKLKVLTRNLGNIVL